jgi:hypothetical protein
MSAFVYMFYHHGKLGGSPNVLEEIEVMTCVGRFVFLMVATNLQMFCTFHRFVKKPEKSSTMSKMTTANELLDMSFKRIIDASLILMDASGIAMGDKVGEDVVDEQDNFASAAEVNEVGALPPLSLREARVYCILWLEVVTINHHFVKREGHRNNHRDYIRDLDALSQALESMRETNSTRGSSLMSWVVRATRSKN